MTEPDTAPIDQQNKTRLDRQTGTVKFFDMLKRFGVIIPEQGGEGVFIHIHDLMITGLTKLKEGQRVAYDTEENILGRGLKAVNVSIEAPIFDFSKILDHAQESA